MTATLLTVGDEILLGQTVNTNAAWLGEALGAAGVVVTRSLAVGDDEAAIRAALDLAVSDSTLVVVTGGLGPTHDDLTRPAVAAYFGRALREDAGTMARIEDRFARRGRTMPERNRVQALVPEGFEVLANDRGTAPGLWFRFEHGGRPRGLACLPGVPAEMRHLFTDRVLPRLDALGPRRTIRHRILQTAGVGESHLADALGDLSGFLDGRTTLAFLPSQGQVRLRVTASGDDPAEVEARVARFADHLRERAGAHVYGEGALRLEAAVGALLRPRGATVAVAESCTGGLVLDRLTDVPGASDYVLGGVVAYNNYVKTAVLGVHERMLVEDGAVSERVARRMAEGVRVRFGATYALATTGVAGPGGGTEEKPVGTVWIALAGPDGSFARRFVFGDDRRFNKVLSATQALDLFRRWLERRAEDG